MKRKLLLSLLILLILGMSFRVLAWETIWPRSPMGTDFNKDSVLVDMVKYFYEWGVFIGGILLFISVLFGGFLYLTSAGNPTRLNEAKDRIFSAIIGVVLLFSIYLILNTINPELTILIPPGQGLGGPCDTEVDCPKGTLCEGDPVPGDGRKEGRCVFSSTLGCDKNIDCYEAEEEGGRKGKECTGGALKGDGKTPFCNALYDSVDCPNNLCCDANPAKGIKGTCVEPKICSKKLAKQGDGNKTGFCTTMCKKVTFYEKINFGEDGGCLTVGYQGLAEADPGCSFEDMTEDQDCHIFANNTKVQSIKMEGGKREPEKGKENEGGPCMIYLFEPPAPSFIIPPWLQHVDCGIEKAALIISGSVSDLNLDYGTSKGLFKAATIRGLGQY